MSISEVSAATPIRSPTPAPVQAVRPVDAPAPVAVPLAPAVRVDIRAGAAPAVEEKPAVDVEAGQTERRVTVDQDTKSLVYQLVDPSSGDIVVQLPDPVVLKARAYAAASLARNQDGERPLDRTA